MPYRKLLKVIELICQNYTIEVSTLNAMLKDIVDEFEDECCTFNSRRDTLKVHLK